MYLSIHRGHGSLSGCHKSIYDCEGAKQNINILCPDDGSDRFYEDIIEIDVDQLEPHIDGSYTPDLPHPLSKFSHFVQTNS